MTRIIKPQDNVTVRDLFEQLDQTVKCQPLFDGNILDKEARRQLSQMGLVMRYEDPDNESGWVLTETGKTVYSNMKNSGHTLKSEDK